MPPDPPRTLAPAARAKSAFGILFSANPQSQKCCAVPAVFIALEWRSLLYLYRISMQEIQIVRVRKSTHD